MTEAQIDVLIYWSMSLSTVARMRRRGWNPKMDADRMDTPKPKKKP